MKDGGQEKHCIFLQGLQALMWSVLPTWAYPPSDPLHTPYYTLYIGFCQIKKNFLDRSVFWVYNRISPPGLIYNIYRCRQLIPSDILWGFFLCHIKVGKTTCDSFSTNQKKIKICHLCIQRCGVGVVVLARLATDYLKYCE